MTFPALATTDDVTAILGEGALTSAQLATATTLLAMASGMVRGYTRQILTAVAADVVDLQGVWGHTITLPQRPVTNVATVLINDATPPFAAWEVIGDELFIGTGAFQPDYGSSLWGGPGLWGPAGSSGGPQSTGASWQGPEAVVTVTYDHGYTDIPTDIVNEVAGMVALQMASPVGIKMENLGRYRAEYALSPVGGMVLTPETKDVLNLYRRRSASTSLATRR